MSDNQTAPGFLDQKEPQAQATTEPTVTADDLVGEGKKFDSVDDLAKGKAYADMYIEDLKQQLVEAKAQAAQGSSIEDLKAELTNLTQNQSTQQVEPNPASEDSQQGLNQDDLNRLVDERLSERQQLDTVRTNQATVYNKMAEQYGADKVDEVASAMSQRLGVSSEWLEDVAGRSPDAFFQLMGEAPKESPSSPMNGTVNTTVPPTSQVKAGTFAFYEQKRKEMGNDAFYGDVRLNQQMMKDAEAPDFYG